MQSETATFSVPEGMGVASRVTESNCGGQFLTHRNSTLRRTLLAGRKEQKSELSDEGGFHGDDESGSADS